MELIEMTKVHDTLQNKYAVVNPLLFCAHKLLYYFTNNNSIDVGLDVDPNQIIHNIIIMIFIAEFCL